MKTFNLSLSDSFTYDVVVVGGGFAGVGAAVTAASNGAKTLLIECGGELGGDITKGIVPQILDPKDKGGLVQEMWEWLSSRDHTSARRGPRYDENGKKIPGTMVDIEYVKYYFEKRCREAGADVMYHSMMAGCNVENGRITSIAVATECGAVSVTADVFIDATGNGLLAAMAGCEYEIGHPETGEPQPAAVSMLVTGFKNPIKCDDYFDKEQLKNELREYGIHVSSEGIAAIQTPVDGVWGLSFNSQFKVMMDDPMAFSNATIEGRAECVETFEKLVKIPRYEGGKLLQICSHIGVREGKRIKGQYRLTYEDITEGRKFEDAICTVRFSIDVHRISENDKYDHAKGKRVQPYNIPYRALLPIGCENLLLAGRCISGDFYAHSSYRVAGCVTPMGEAAGYAAAICSKEGILPSAVDGKAVSKYMASIGHVI